MRRSYWLWSLLLVVALALLSGCAYRSAVTFPAADDVFMTTGDGDIQKPYTPIGQLIYVKWGYRITWMPLLGMIPFGDPDPEYILRDEIARKVKSMGGDALIELRLDWVPGSSGFLGLGARPGKFFCTGTVVKR